VELFKSRFVAHDDDFICRYLIFLGQESVEEVNPVDAWKEVLKVSDRDRVVEPRSVPAFFSGE
jgi:hypothetical protein